MWLLRRLHHLFIFPSADGERYVRIDVKDISQCFVAIRKSLESDGNIFMKINTWAENSGAYHGLVNRMFKANKNDGVDE